MYPTHVVCRPRQHEPASKQVAHSQYIPPLGRQRSGGLLVKLRRIEWSDRQDGHSRAVVMKKPDHLERLGPDWLPARSTYAANASWAADTPIRIQEQQVIDAHDTVEIEISGIG